MPLTFPRTVRSLTSRGWSATASGLRGAVATERLLLAGKTALAAGLAWALAHLMPAPLDHYAYYAPLGALVSMYPTVADSLRNGLQSLVGLSLGIGVALLFGSFTGTSAVAVALVVGAGVVVGGLPRMGTAREWVPMAALFVLVLGGDARDDFSFAYLAQVGLGVALGVALNWLVFPPLRVQAISPAVARIRNALAEQLEDMAAAVGEEWPPEHRDWSEREDSLARTAAGARRAVEEAEVSARANPRRRHYRHTLSKGLEDLRAIERATFQVQDVTDVLASVIWEEHAGTTVPAELTPELAGALSATAEALRTIDDPDALDAALDRAQEALDVLSGSYHEVAARQTSVTATAAIGLALSRILRIIRSHASRA
ncbi:hypothetical protein GCM10012320_00200 [Sinomonas cellulolyticus]|uniref:FUSC family protein n=1 Tax=Sinomonas cellulolyticus TaxID=2801916 RepID=A0ABS1K0J7_9MICC|nr:MULTISPECIES: aromatic acid exporter family protein [Sinomonas]MBL0705140.1 hypothetical protein [Sinomonas cellulolyticus]GHG39497.1 hypothetical protein GCM10012320_00200 [Sinomonas sp. KCTC 49339]